MYSFIYSMYIAIYVYSIISPFLIISPDLPMILGRSTGLSIVSGSVDDAALTILLPIGLRVSPLPLGTAEDFRNLAYSAPTRL